MLRAIWFIWFIWFIVFFVGLVAAMIAFSGHGPCWNGHTVYSGTTLPQAVCVEDAPTAR
jgi:hypothetical protein